MRLLFSQKGQGAIEAALALPLLVVVGSIFILFLYRGMVFYFADYQLHEALICTESTAVTICEKELKSRLEKVLIAKTSSKVHLRKTGRSTQGSISVELTPPFHLEQTLKKASAW